MRAWAIFTAAWNRVANTPEGILDLECCSSSERKFLASSLISGIILWSSCFSRACTLSRAATAPTGVACRGPPISPSIARSSASDLSS